MRRKISIISLNLVVFLFLVFLSSQYVDCQADDNIMTFDEFMTKFDKSYSSNQEKQKREQIFNKNVRKIINFNKKQMKNGSDMRLGVNEFSDLELNEVAMDVGVVDKFYDDSNITVIDDGSDDNTSDDDSFDSFISRAAKKNHPKEFTWRSKQNKVTQVLNQKSCKADWAFAVTHSIETIYANKKNTNVIRFSTQELIDCVSASFGCTGGNLLAAATYVKNRGGISKSVDYPYDALKATCDAELYTPQTFTIKALVLLSGPLKLLRDKIYKNGPLPVVLVASSQFLSYQSGLFIDQECEGSKNSPSGAFSVSIFGYGTQKKKDYWVLRYSNGISWGINGYMHLPTRFPKHIYCNHHLKPLYIEFS